MSPQPTYTAAQLRRARAMGGDLADALARVVRDDHATAQATTADLGSAFAPDRLARWVANAPMHHDCRCSIAPAMPINGSGVGGKMNRTELAYAQRLDAMRTAGRIGGWWFEPFALRLAAGWRTVYRPDFLIAFGDRDKLEVHEVKGFWRDDARVKIKVAAALYPCFGFVAVTRKRGEWREERF